MFIDRAKIHVEGGNGGNGVTAFRREKFVPRGGPSGGDGGRGGDVILVADVSFNTLLHLRYNPRHIADRGLHGEGSNRSGHTGADRIVNVPVGTQIFDSETGELLADLDHDGARWLAARGGRGGFGNAHFTTSTNRAPRYHQDGGKGEVRDLQLELKLIADVGLVGFPNAGKSTFISTVSAAKPKIADYPFTTLEPNLGVVDLGDFRTFVIADIPGLIEGAHTGAGLGDRFLRHIERTKLLLHLVDVSSVSGRDTVADYETVNRELSSYNSELAVRPQLVVATKMDALDERERLESLRLRVQADGKPFFAISSATGEGVRDLVNAIAAKLDELKVVNNTETVELVL
ncbi:MAG TPA: GTPase ObgE [Pyrinomonadaceae bacterium]|jgi:Obg family GTPase CgtA|nr:GTPase ObgE [Pyrinomonadaceae bacterium]